MEAENTVAKITELEVEVDPLTKLSREEAARVLEGRWMTAYVLEEDPEKIIDGFFEKVNPEVRDWFFEKDEHDRPRSLLVRYSAMEKLGIDIPTPKLRPGQIRRGKR